MTSSKMDNQEPTNPYAPPRLHGTDKTGATEALAVPPLINRPVNQNCRIGVVLVLAGVIVFPPLVLVGTVFCHVGMRELRRSPGEYRSVSRTEGLVGLIVGYTLIVLMVSLFVLILLD